MKYVHNTLNLSRLISSQIVVDENLIKSNHNPIHFFKQTFINRQALKKIVYLFPDFKKQQFTFKLIDIYSKLAFSSELGDHVNMIKYLSVDNYYKWRDNHEAFQFYDRIIDIGLQQARVLQNQNGTWAQLTYKFIFSQNRRYINQFHVFQRKHNIYNATDFWRIRKFNV